MQTTTPYIVIQTTTPDTTLATAIAKALIEARLAACVQVSSAITSHYSWQGVVEATTEYRLDIKTRADLYDQVATIIHDLHPYDVPEIIVLPIIDGSQAYLDWVGSQTDRI